jgi:hypothetical protein
MRRFALAALLLAVLALAGCTTTGTTASKKFTGAAADVSKAVAEIQTAGQRKDTTKLCTTLLSRSLVSKLDSGGSKCADEMDKAIADADDFKLSVNDVKVSGTEATATVKEHDLIRTIQFVREDNRWKASGFAKG